MANTIALEKEIAQNLTCNRLTQNVDILWFKVIIFRLGSYSLSNYNLKDGREYTDPVYNNQTVSILTLRGRANEIGTYECRWKNSRGESRHRQFTVSVTFAQESNTRNIIAAVSVTLVAIIAIGFGTAIKVYLDKVSDIRFTTS